MRKVLLFFVATVLACAGVMATGAFNKAVEATTTSVDSDPNLIEIPQSQGKEYDDFERTPMEECDGYTLYTASKDLQIAIKMMNVDVKDCDYVVIKFAEPVAAGWKLAFWSGQDLVDVPAGSTEYKYVFADDAKCGVKDGVLPQICMMTFFGGYTAPLEAKVVGIYKHQTSSAESEAAVLVSATPEAGSKVDLDTEYTFTFSAPVKYSVSLSSIYIGLNPFGNGDGATFTQSEDGKTITAKLDKELLALYGIKTAEDAAAKMGSSVKVSLYKVKDAATGEVIEGCYDEEEDEPALAIKYRLGDPTLVADPKDGEVVKSLDVIMFSCPEGIALADESKNILVMKNKEQILSVPASQLEAVANDWGFFDEDEEDDWGFGGETTISHYELKFEKPLEEKGTYEVYVPAGTFTLGGEATNATAIFTYIVDDAAPSKGIIVTPAPGTVTELKDFEFTYNGGEGICPSSQDGCDINIMDAATWEVVATITQDELNMNIDEECLDATGWNVIKCKAHLSQPITAAGEYVMEIPAGAFYVGDNYDSSEFTNFSWKIEGGAVEPAVEKPATWAELADSKAYTLTTKRATLLWDGESAQLGTSVNPTAIAYDATSANQQFYLLKSATVENVVYVYNLGAKKWMGKSSNNASLVETLQPGDQSVTWYIKTSDVAEYPLMIDAADGNHFNMGGSSQITIDSWSTADDGNRFTVVAVADADAQLVKALRDEINVYENGIVPGGDDDDAEIAGAWKENVSGWYYNNDWVAVSIQDADVNIVADGQGGYVISNILGEGNTLKGTVEGNTLSIPAGQTIGYDGYDWTAAGSSETEAVIGTIAGNTITINNLNLYYSGYSYTSSLVITLTKGGDQPQPEEPGEETIVAGRVIKSWTNDKGYAYTNWSKLPYEDGKDSYEVKVKLANGKVTVVDWEAQGDANDNLTVTYDKETGVVSSIAEATLYDGYYWLYTKIDIDNYPDSPGCYVYPSNSKVISTEKGGLLYISCYSFEGEANASPFILVEWDNAADGINAISTTNQNAKFLKNGQLFILKNGKLYNAAGIQVK